MDSRLTWILGGIRFELRDTHDYKLSDANDKFFNEPPTSIIYLKVSLSLHVMCLFAPKLIFAVHSPPFSGHVPSVLSIGPPHTKALSVATGVALFGDWAVCSSNQQEKSV